MKYTFLFAMACIISQTAIAQDAEPKGKTSLWDKLNAPKVIPEEKRLPVDSTTNKVSYIEVVNAVGASKENLIKKAKKWTAAKNTATNPYIISFENEQEGSIVAKGTFALPGGRKKYAVQFVMTISTKANKFKYEFTDFIIRFHTEAGASGGGYAYWGKSSYHEAETLEYPLETFYPARLHGRKPGIKFFEEIDSDSFATINKEIQSVIASLKQALSSKDDW